MSYRINRNLNKHKKKTLEVKPIQQEIVLGDYSFPIYGVKMQNGNFSPFEIHGTCFYIGNNYFLSANHVIENAKLSEFSKIGFLSQVTNGCVQLHDYEIMERFEQEDLVLLKSDSMTNFEKKPKAFAWSGKEILIFEEIRSMGFPYGFDSFRGYTSGRGYSGTLVGEIDFIRGDLKTRCYELSFQAPRGLSGGFLIDSHYKVHGMIIGNSETEKSISYDKFVIKSGKGEIEKIEITNQITFIGLALTERFIFKLYSNHLQMNFHKYLQNANLH